MMLEGTVYREGKQTFHDLALNDIVMNRSGNLMVVNYDVYVNDEYLNSFTADGMIVSTPTGSYRIQPVSRRPDCITDSIHAGADTYLSAYAEFQKYCVFRG